MKFAVMKFALGENSLYLECQTFIDCKILDRNQKIVLLCRPVVMIRKTGRITDYGQPMKVKIKDI